MFSLLYTITNEEHLVKLLCILSVSDSWGMHSDESNKSDVILSVYELVHQSLQKVNKLVEGKLGILSWIRSIAIKSSETREVTYTCRYTSGPSIPIGYVALD